MEDKGDKAISADIMNKPGVVGKEEGAQEFRPTERRVMQHDTSNLDQSQVRSTKMEGGRIVYRIGGVEVSKEEFFKKK